MFEITTSVYAENGQEIDQGLLDDYLAAIGAEFCESPEFEALQKTSDQFNHVSLFLDYAAQYCGATVATMTLGDTREVLFDLFPRKVSIDPSAAPSVIAELRAFWKFIERTRNLPSATRMQTLLDDDAAEELEDLLGDQSNFGMAKSFFSAGRQQGFDMSTQAGLNAFIDVYNQQMRQQSQAVRSRNMAAMTQASRKSPGDEFAMTASPQYVNAGSKVGRNNPCSCGSGKKFKKCCGRTD